MINYLLIEIEKWELYESNIRVTVTGAHANPPLLIHTWFTSYTVNTAALQWSLSSSFVDKCSQIVSRWKCVCDEAAGMWLLLDYISQSFSRSKHISSIINVQVWYWEVESRNFFWTISLWIFSVIIHSDVANTAIVKALHPQPSPASFYSCHPQPS